MSVDVGVVICSYMASNRRLVIPRLGAIIRKGEGQAMVFSSLMHRDDGVLLGAVQAAGANQIEAVGLVDRFVFEVRHALETEQAYHIQNLGYLVRGAEGALLFQTDEEYHLSKEQERLKERAASVATASTPESTTPPEVVAEPAVVPPPVVAPVEVAVPVPAVSEPASEPEKEPEVAPQSPPAVSKSAKMDPDPSLKGLNYGTPRKGSSYTRRSSKKGVDKFIVVAIAAAVLAIAAIAYGYIRKAQNEAIIQEFVEQAIDQATKSSDSLNVE